jgi:gamma-glutamyltranspeptidase/glutathione hydrolase
MTTEGETTEGAARRPVLAGSGMVSSSHPAVSALGARVLADGGNATDAALAMAALSWIALPGQCGVGGDAFALVRDPGGTVHAFSGSGFGPDGGDPGFYAELGLRAVPVDGSLAVAVPGAIAALAAVHSHGASRELPALWSAAATAAEQGLPCTAKTRDDIRAHRETLARDAAVFLPLGAPPRVGQRLPQPELAGTIRSLASDPAALYSGDLAERSVASLRAAGAPFTGGEWEACGHVAPEAPITGKYAGREVYQTPLPTSGWMVLQQAAVCDGLLAGEPHLGPAAVHVLASAARLAFADRVARCGSDNDAWRAGLTADAVRSARVHIRAGDLPARAVGVPGGDTTSVVAVDADGGAVSLIHSLGFTFGARTTVPGTGIMLNNRLGRGAYLQPGHPNEVHPRRRPLHTLNAWLVTDEDGRLVHAGNTPGGDGQVQWNMQLLSHLLDHGRDPQQAVDAPRFTVFPGSDADVLDSPDALQCESRLGPGTLDGLRRRGHAVTEQGPWAGGGSALVVSVDAELGCLLGGADSRQDGVALGV